MKRILMLLCAFDACVIVDRVASADPEVRPMVFRQSANRYSVLGEGVLETKDCTVTADGMAARITTDVRGRYIVFLDRDGEEEAECEVRTTAISYPRPVLAGRARPVKVATK